MTSSLWLDQINPRILRCWRGNWMPGTIEPARALYEHELVLVTEGACTVRVEKTSHVLAAGHYIIIPPAALHISTAGGEGVHRACIHFDWTHVPGRSQTPICRFYPEKLPAEQVVQAPSWVPTHLPPGVWEADSPVLSLVDALFDRWASADPIQAATSRAVLQELLLRLLWRENSKPAAPDRSTQIAWLVKDLLDSHFNKPDCIRTLLAPLGFSYEHLCRTFHHKFGIAPLTYLNAQRLERAKALLPNPRLTIAEIAYANGFHDAGYFTRKFRERYGVVPSDLR
ncbi:AraC family transcriptional regulator [Verrucomicrobia bacterium LW23]|nr:AraC family transcriptional regulator [Verrucomicrobia bacterium LW23]